MTPTPAEREVLFKAFGKAFAARDVDQLYAVVTPDFLWSYHDGLLGQKVLSDPAAIKEHFDEQNSFYAATRFHEVTFHHLPDMTFMIFRVSETVRSTGEQREQRGIERYTFKDGRIATKDVFRKPMQANKPMQS
jgi:ketosteroid isomerase-like protein